MKISEINKVKISNLIGLILIILASLIITEYHLGRLNLGVDQLRQYEAAKTLISGKGLVTSEVNFNDLSTPNETIFTGFPPGFSILVSPLFNVSKNIRTVHLIFTFINLLLFILLAFKLASMLSFRKISLLQCGVALIFLALNGTFIYLAGGTDLICVNLFILSSILLLKSHSVKHKTGLLAITSLLLVLTVYFRYAYFPALLVLPVFFLIRTIIFRTTEWPQFIMSIVFTALSSVPFLGHIAYINLQSGYVQEKTGDVFRLHWENLTRVSPFPLHGFFDIFPFLRFIGYTSKFGYDRGYSYPFYFDLIFYLLSILILIPVFIYLRKFINGTKINTPNAVFGLYTFIFSVALIGFVYIGSLINPSASDLYNWSWAKVFRYYILPVFAIQLIYFLIILNGKNYFNKKLIFIILTLSLSYASALKLYNYTFNYKAFNFKHNITKLQPNDMALNSYEIHKFLPASNSKSYVAFIDASITNRLYNPKYFLALNNFTSASVAGKFNMELSSMRPIDIYIFTDSVQTNTSELIKKYNAKKVKEIENTISIFKLNLIPNKNLR